MVVLVAVCGLFFSACFLDPDEEGDSRQSAIPLTEDAWTDGAISSVNTEQWFKFTATTGTQYVHVFFGTLTTLYVQLYDSNNNELGSSTGLNDGWWGSYTSLTVTRGREYYIKVTGSGTGTYRIGFTTTPTAPGILVGAIPLTIGAWADGVITSSNGEQWFMFTASASMLYLHAFFGTLETVYVQLHDSNGATLGSSTTLNDFWGSYTSFLVTSGQVYYVKVTGSGTGTYRLAISTSETAPRN